MTRNAYRPMFYWTPHFGYNARSHKVSDGHDNSRTMENTTRPNFIRGTKDRFDHRLPNAVIVKWNTAERAAKSRHKNNPPILNNRHGLHTHLYLGNDNDLW